MVQVLKAGPSFGALLGQNLGAGLGSGLARATDFAQQMAMEKSKVAQKQKLFQDVMGQGQPQAMPEEQKRKLFLDSLPEFENIKRSQSGEDLTTEDLDGIWQNFDKIIQAKGMQAEGMQKMGPTEDLMKKARAAAMIGEHDLSRTFSEEAKISEKRGVEERKLAFDETKDYRKHVTDQARSAKELEPVLDQMEGLIKGKKLTNPIIAKLAEKTGMVGLLDPTSQQFNALSIGFLKDAKTIFGSRVTNFDLETYLDKIPRLAQTDAGKKALISNFRALGEASKVREKVKNEILKENNGIPPLDLETQVDERAAPKLDKLAEKFNKTFIESSRSSSGKIRMRNPSGGLGEVDESNVQKAIEKGYKLE